MKKFIVVTILISITVFQFFSHGNKRITVKADQLSENIEEQLENIDLTKLEEFLYSLEYLPNDVNFIQMIYDLIEGEYNHGINDVLNYSIMLLANEAYNAIPTIISVLIIAIFYTLIKNLRSNALGDGILNIINLVCILSIFILLGRHLIVFYNIAKNTIENIAKLNSIMSPIILTLMISSGGKVSAGIYSPIVAFLSNGIIGLVNGLIMPIICILIVFATISNLSDKIKLNKLSDFFQSVIKWIIGLIISIFSIFITVQGISASTYDGISIKALKYTISNSVPIIGGFLSGGFEIVMAGSVLIKNTLGIVSVFILFYTIISPVLSMAIFSFLLKFIAGITETIGNGTISSFCMSIAKCISYLIAITLMVGFMFFISSLLMTLTANSIF